MEHEFLEEACDNLANAIDKLDGEASLNWIAFTINELLSELEFSTQELLEMFENLYQCNPHQYAQNTVNDAVWVAEHGEDII